MRLIIIDEFSIVRPLHPLAPPPLHEANIPINVKHRVVLRLRLTCRNEAPLGVIVRVHLKWHHVWNRWEEARQADDRRLRVFVDLETCYGIDRSDGGDER